MKHTDFIRTFFEKHFDVICKAERHNQDCIVTAKIPLTKVIDLARNDGLSVCIVNGCLDFGTNDTTSAYKNNLAKSVIKKFELTQGEKPGEFIDVQELDKVIADIQSGKAGYDTTQRIRMITGADDIIAGNIERYIVLELSGEGDINKETEKEVKEVITANVVQGQVSGALLHFNTDSDWNEESMKKLLFRTFPRVTLVKAKEESGVVNFQVKGSVEDLDVLKEILGVGVDKDFITLTSGFDNHLENALEQLDIPEKHWELRAMNGDKILTVDGFNEEKYEQLVKDLKPDFNADYDKKEKGLTFKEVK